MRRCLSTYALVILAVIIVTSAFGAERTALAAPPRPTRPAPVTTLAPTRLTPSSLPTRGALPTVAATPRPRPSVTIAPVTPLPRPTLAATVAPVSDPAAALTACSQGIFGVNLTFTRSGGLTGQMARSLNLPEVVGAAIAANGTAVYGVAADRSVVAVVMGGGSASSADVAVQVNTASLCTVQLLRTQVWPGDAGAALATLLVTFPGAPQSAEYTPTTSSSSHAFSAVTTRPVLSTGTLTTQGVILAMTKASSSQALLSAISGTGEYAADVGD